MALFNQLPTQSSKYRGLLTVDKVDGSQNVLATSTHPIGIKVNGNQPPIADAGYDFKKLSQSEMEDLFDRAGGLKMENLVLSLETGDASNLTFEWEPRSYFSRDAGVNATSTNPSFIVSSPGTYDITLTVDR